MIFRKEGVRMGELRTAAMIDSRELDVRTELSRVLESPAFRTSKRSREFLEYVVEHTLNGPDGTLKERLIGVELFQLSTDFDTSEHTIVRVTANEVRKRLAQYYLSENGSAHALRITLPPGSYRAEFKWESPAGDLSAGDPDEAAISAASASMVSAPLASVAEEAQEEPPTTQRPVAPPIGSLVPGVLPSPLSWT